MRFKWIAGLALGLIAAQAGAQTKAPAAAPAKTQPGQTQDASPLKTPQDKTSYAVGVEVGKSLKAQGVEVDSNLLIQGLKDALGSGKLLLTDDEIREIMTSFQDELKAKQQAAAAAAADKNQKDGAAFLEANAKKDGVTALPSGLQYKVVKAADGKKPTEDDTVICNYRGTLIDGTEFDSSYSTGKPATFQVKGLIPGVREALKLMPVGATWQFFIPPDMAYGDRGAGPIGPNSTLVFEIELISIQNPSATPGPAAPGQAAPQQP